MLLASFGLPNNREIDRKETKPLLFDSGNPFISTQTLSTSLLKEFTLWDRVENVAGTDESNVSFVKMFFDNQVKYSINTLNKYNGNIFVLSNTGLAYLNEGEFIEAENYFKKAIELKYDFYPALANLAKLYLIRNKIDEALNIYKKLNNYFPEDLKVMQNMAHIFLRKKNLEAACDVLNKVLVKDKKNASAYNNIGVIFILRKQYDKAISNFRRAIQNNVNFANAYNNLGVCYSYKKEYRKAINYYLSAISLNKRFSEAIKNLASSYQDIGEYEKAHDFIESAIQYVDNDPEVFDIQAYSLYKLEKYDKALVKLRNALNLATKANNVTLQASILNNIGVVNARRNAYADAEKSYLESIEYSSETPIAFNNLIKLYLGNNKQSKAKAIIERAKGIFQHNYDLLLSEGKYLYVTKQYDRVCEVLNEAIEIKPQLPDPYVQLNYIYTEVYSDYGKALSFVREGLKYNPKNVMLLNNLAYTLLMSGNLKEAREVLGKVDDMNNVCLVATKGLLLIKENKVQAGEEFYNRAANLAKGDKNFYNQVKQKKNLELGRYYNMAGEKQKAISYLRKALNMKVDTDIYRKHSEKLLSNLA